MWFWIWFVLVLAALAGAVLLGRSLWRRVKSTTRAAGEALGSLDRLAEKIDALEGVPVGPEPRPVDVFADSAARHDLAELVASRRTARRSRRRARYEADADRYEQWRHIDL
ncbi:hypothetical protein Sked_18540 [Sanguibacter keddieii DSM 10542]|uniref:Uncharacterized protein n=1 Tax=Sanguibacter keddieii (strain ATCC 51767 / DSM 10542 / NCFB 3025 / ST-74) TaxID=446469 RepID=D1BH60_SANKS|nr:hypothetical protein [Sanguibacter keddieii]ACZ21780.1 hypothetical protein Sked_18540 [Sanguibacter keddieii DSM 10542]